jgi:hypothetical protein
LILNENKKCKLQLVAKMLQSIQIDEFVQFLVEANISRLQERSSL